VFNVVLYEPEIPPNTGNIIRLCANTGVRLHLIEPLGFTLQDRELRRAGLDYHEYAEVRQHPALSACLAALDHPQVFAFTSRGAPMTPATAFARGCVLLFGPETRGLPRSVLDTIESVRHLRIPMVAGSRSLNLANAVAVAVYTAWQQHGFAGAAPHSPAGQ
jgi:tRNA (cytidine/uridine-2'-O-)-methyltransferase